MIGIPNNQLKWIITHPGGSGLVFCDELEVHLVLPFRHARLLEGADLVRQMRQHLYTERQKLHTLTGRYINSRHLYTESQKVHTLPDRCVNTYTQKVRMCTACLVDASTLHKSTPIHRKLEGTQHTWSGKCVNTYTQTVRMCTPCQVDESTPVHRKLECAHLVRDVRQLRQHLYTEIQKVHTLSGSCVNTCTVYTESQKVPTQT